LDNRRADRSIAKRQLCAAGAPLSPILDDNDRFLSVGTDLRHTHLLAVQTFDLPGRFSGRFFCVGEGEVTEPAATVGFWGHKKLPWCRPGQIHIPPWLADTQEAVRYRTQLHSAAKPNASHGTLSALTSFVFTAVRASFPPSDSSINKPDAFPLRRRVFISPPVQCSTNKRTGDSGVGAGPV